MSDLREIIAPYAVCSCPSEGEEPHDPECLHNFLLDAVRDTLAAVRDRLLSCSFGTVVHDYQIEQVIDDMAVQINEARLPSLPEGGPDEVLFEVRQERAAQHRQWGEQNHPDGTGKEYDWGVPDLVRADCERAFAAGTGTWRHILTEEVAEAYAESDPARLRAELVQVAAVAVAWIEAIDRRAEPEGATSHTKETR